MRWFTATSAVLGFITIATLPCTLAKPLAAHIEEFRQLHNASQIVKRCTGGETTCGYYGQLCCASGQQCYKDSAGQAQCGQIWQATPAPVATANAACGSSQQPCGGICCDSGFYCKINGQCALLGGGSSGGILPTPSAPVRPTISGVVIITYTGAPTVTRPFETPVPTGAAGSLPQTNGGGGLSGGAIAGIVIGVILGILLLLLLCLFCCARALFDTIAAIFGFGKKRKHTHEETFIEEHHHRTGSAAAAGGGRRWFGGPARPPRSNHSEKQSGAGKGLGMAAALGGLALALGLKRKHDRKAAAQSTVSGSSYYYSDYTSESSASSSDRHTRRTRDTRHSSRR